jgi:hypothetical protein
LPIFLQNDWSLGRYSKNPIKLTVCGFCKKEFFSTVGKYCSISCANMDRTLSTETKNKISRSKFGHVVTLETRNKITDSVKEYYNK